MLLYPKHEPIALSSFNFDGTEQSVNYGGYSVSWLLVAPYLLFHLEKPWRGGFCWIAGIEISLEPIPEGLRPNQLAYKALPAKLRLACHGTEEQAARKVIKIAEYIRNVTPRQIAKWYKKRVNGLHPYDPAYRPC